MDVKHWTVTRTVRCTALFLSLAFLGVVPFAAWYLGEQPLDVFHGLMRIFTSPSPLVTDYFGLGSLSSAFLNAGLCGLACAALICFLDAPCQGSTWAGYFLVVAHCFYGLNFITLWPCIFGVWAYCKWMKIGFRDNLDIAMFSTAFGPFMGELLFRYPFRYLLIAQPGGYALNLLGIPVCFLLGAFLGFVIAALLPGAQLLHQGFDLYNGGLAFGLLGLLVYGFLYPGMGVDSPAVLSRENPVYQLHGNSYGMFCGSFFLLLFLFFLAFGWWSNGCSFRGYGLLMKDSGHRADFIQQYGAPCVFINLGIYGLLVLGYITLAILLTPGDGFTGATTGVILAAMSFAASGQHPRNVWPILAGFCALYLLSLGVGTLVAEDLRWTLSSQSYLNGAAFATGLCPFTGRYGKRAGLYAGLLCATMCACTSGIHGGLVLYNGGLTAGITALILKPLLDHYDLRSRRLAQGVEKKNHS